MLRSTFVDRGVLDAVVHLVFCFVGSEFFLYVGATEDQIDEYLKRMVPALRKKAKVRDAMTRVDQELATETMELQRCNSARELYAAEQGWIELLRSAFPSSVLNGNGGGVTLGTWRFQLGDEVLRGYLPLSMHRLNAHRHSVQHLQTRLEVYGWPLPRVLGSEKRTSGMRTASRGANRVKEQIEKRQIGARQRQMRWPAVLDYIHRKIAERTAASSGRSVAEEGGDHPGQLIPQRKGNND